MKTNVIFSGLIAFTITANAQWSGGSLTGPTDRSGNVGIGVTASSPVQLDVNFDASPSTFSQFGTRSHITQIAPLAGGAHLPYVGVEGWQQPTTRESRTCLEL